MIVQTVTVVLTSYNCGEFLPQAIESVLGQTHSQLELLISDDRSTDGSDQIAERFAKKDSRIRFFRQETNLGLIGNYNFLFVKASGALVTVQDADDWSDPTRLAKQVAALDDPQMAICGTGAQFHYPGGETRLDATVSSHAIEGLSGDFPSVPASVMFRRNLLDLYAGWSTWFEGGTSMDRYFLMDLLDGRRGWHIGEPLYHARVRAGSNHRNWSPRKYVTHKIYLELERQRRARGSDWLRDKDFNRLAQLEARLLNDRRVRAESLREAAVIEIDCGNLRTATMLLRRALLNDLNAPASARTLLYLARKTLRAG